MSYFVSPRKETDWRIPAASFAERVAADWPGSEVGTVDSPESNRSVEWVTTIDGLRIDGSLDKAGQAGHLDGDIDACAQFALWVRSQVPPDQELIFYDEAFSVDVPISSSSTAEELADAFA